MPDLTRSRKRATSSGMGDAGNVQDPVARELIRQLQESIYSMGLSSRSGSEVSTPAQDNTIANLKREIQALNDRLKTLETAGRQKILIMNGGPGNGREDTSFPPYSVVEIVGRNDQALLVTTPTEYNLPPWKLAFVAEGGLGPQGHVGFAYPAISGINTALVQLYLDPEPPVMGRLGTRRDSYTLYYGVLERYIGDNPYYNEVGSGFVALSPPKETGDYGVVHDVVYEYLQSPGIHLGGYMDSYTILPPIPRHGVREAIVFEKLGASTDEVAQVWRAVPGMPEYTPMQLLTNLYGVPEEAENPWGEAGGV